MVWRFFGIWGRQSGIKRCTYKVQIQMFGACQKLQSFTLYVAESLKIGYRFIDAYKVSQERFLLKIMQFIGRAEQ